MGINVNGDVFRIDTDNSSYVFMVKNGYLAHLYYGSKIDALLDLSYVLPSQIRSFASYDKDIGNKFSLDFIPQEYAGFGCGDFRQSAVKIKNASGESSTKFKYVSYKIISGRKIDALPCSRAGGNTQTLEITMQDYASNCQLNLYYTAFDSDVIARSAKITNLSECPVSLLKASSFSMDINNDGYELLYFMGCYGRERELKSKIIEDGEFVISSNKGATGHNSNPCFIIKDKFATENSGNCYGFNLIYSGNFKASVEQNYLESIRVNLGINDEGFEWQLSQNESFCTPEAILTFSKDGVGKVSQNFSDHIRNNIMPQNFAYKTRPLVINSWEACVFDIDENKLIEFSKVAAKIGLDTLVIDDGWFGRRNNEHQGLGDWQCNYSKFPKGIKHFVDKIKEIGLNVGIWIEPEMVNEDSDLYQAHPDWILHNKSRKSSYCRDQLVLDFSNPTVVEYIFNSIYSTLKTSGITYIKWDMNRCLTEVGSSYLPNERQGEVSHRYVLGVYKFYEMLATAMPNALIEACSGGGGRYDLGMLYYSPQIWTSDNTDPFCRANIQYATSFGYPISSMSCHVSDTPNWVTNVPTTLKFRFDTAANGILGYEMDLIKLNDAQINEMALQVKDYKLMSDVILRGDFYRLISPISTNYYSYMIMSKDKKIGYFTFLQLVCSSNTKEMFVKLVGVDSKKHYKINNEVYAGSVLINIGLKLPPLYGNGQSILLKIEQI